jgi:dihydropteroate synthase
LTIQLVEIFHPNVFRKYCSKFNIFRELYEKDLLGLEIRAIDYKLGQKIKKVILSSNEICFSTGKKGDVKCDILILGNYYVFKELSKQIIANRNEEIGLRIKRTIQNIFDYENKFIQIGKRKFTFERAYTIGILNVTPDSFSDGGKFFDKSKAVEHGLQLIEDGADILDIGGESSRPGSESVPDEEELNRVIPVIEEIIKQKPDAIISIDTTKSNVAKEALKLGAKIINDISSFSDPCMLDVIKEFNATVILMHMQGIPKTMQVDPGYDEVISEVYDFLFAKVEYAKKSGIHNIIIDPGIGFGKRVMDNYELIKRLNEFKGIGQGILIGVSNKSFIGKALNLEVQNREEATLISETIAIGKGARFVRTHNVKKLNNAIKLNRFFDNPELLQDV